ncbi:MAG: adenylyl-sulfate kinase [Bdellovibrionales bacterium]|nr:adenylyl-sulfate kinase [Bdellovibrionales bacterium]
MKIVVAGHVDHGKSTLLGKLLNDTNQVFPEKIEKIKKNCEKNGKKFEYAFILDAFEEEQSQGITIDKTEIPWVYQGLNYIFIDTPGHREFLKNMISGASTADAALVMLDAEEGVKEQFKLHSYTLNLLGIKNLIIVVNKMDLVEYSQKRFEELSREINQIYTQYKITSKSIIPVSAFYGENLLSSSDFLNWFKGPTLAEAVALLSKNLKEKRSHLRLSVQDTYKFDEKRIYVGKIESGELCVGDHVKFLPSGSVSQIKTIEEWNVSGPIKKALTNESVGFTLSNPLYLERGEVGAILKQSLPIISYQIHASLFWLGKKPLEKNKNYKFKILTQETDCKIESIFNVFNSGHDKNSRKEVNEVNNAEAAEVIIKFNKNMVCDQFIDFESTGRFVIMDNSQVVGGGIIINANSIYTRQEKSHLSYEERSQKLGHKGAVLWLTGLPSSGKSTIAKGVEQKLFHMNIHTIILDGDNLRKGLNKDLGFSSEDRKENIRRAAEVARLLSENGSIAIVALISPNINDRQMARSICYDSNFFEVFIECSLEECEKRDPKGLYKKARNGEIRGFTGVDAEYELPLKSDIKINTQVINPESAVENVLKFLFENKILDRIE